MATLNTPGWCSHQIVWKDWQSKCQIGKINHFGSPWFLTDVAHFCNTNFTVEITRREKCPNTEFFLVRIFPHSAWIRRDTPYLSVFSPNAAKYGPEKTPYLDTFNAVLFASFWKRHVVKYVSYYSNTRQ